MRCEVMGRMEGGLSRGGPPGAPGQGTTRASLTSGPHLCGPGAAAAGFAGRRRVGERFAAADGEKMILSTWGREPAGGLGPWDEAWAGWGTRWRWGRRSSG